MDDGLLSLKWNNHRTTFFHILSNLRKKQTYTDVTIACDGKFFPVHKLVMSTCSDYFSEIFDKTTCKAPVIVLKDIKPADLEALLDYMYLGEVDVKQSELAGLIKAAECLRIKGLAVPDEDPSTPKKSSHVPERQSTPPSKRRRRSSGLEDSHYSHKSSRSHSPLSSSRSHTSTSVPSHSVSGDNLSQVPSMPSFQDQRHKTNSSHEPEVVDVDMIKVEPEEDQEQNQQDQSHLLDHSSADDPGDDSGGLDGGSLDDLRDKKDQLTNDFSDFDPSGEIEKEEVEQMDPYSDSDQLAGPSGLQGGSSMSQWGDEEGGFPPNLFGGEDPSQQQQVLPPNSTASGSNPVFTSIGDQLIEIPRVLKEDHLGIKRYMYGCPVCKKLFHMTSNVRDHIRIHTGEKPFMCELCDYRSRQKSNLLTHVKRKHGAGVNTTNSTGSGTSIGTGTSISTGVVPVSSTATGASASAITTAAIAGALWKSLLQN